MLEVETTSIDGYTYEVTKLPYKRGRKLLLRLYKSLGPALADAMGSVPELGGLESLDELEVQKFLPSLAALVRTLADTLSEEDMEFMEDTLIEHTQFGQDGKLVPLKGNAEFHFSGNYSVYFQWLAFALKINYLGFFDGQGLLQKVKAMAAAAAAASPSLNTSIGTSTGSPQASATPAA